MKKTIAILMFLMCMMTLYESCEGNRSGKQPYHYTIEDGEESIEAEEGEECEDSIESKESEVKISEGSSKYHSGSYHSSSRESESEYANDGHPGTKPDDGLFGFDPWDDEDDAYDVERNQVDPYPDEW